MNIKQLFSKFISKKKKMNSVQLISGIKDGSIKILEKEHLMNPVKHKLTERLKELEKYTNVSVGERIMGVDFYCCNCDCTCYAILTDEKTIALIPQEEYWNLEESKGYDYKFQESDSKDCIAKELEEQQKLVATIEVPTGNIVFKNYFETEKLFEDEENRFKKPTINSLLGRNKLMQYLAKENVGYGQMGNMSVAIYYNEKKNEIIVTSPYWEEEIENRREKLKGSSTSKEKLKNLESIEKELNEFEYKGRISLSVWRWMCTDKSILDENNEPLQNEKHKDMVNFQIKAGKWEIEHYFDFTNREGLIYSRIKLIE